MLKRCSVVIAFLSASCRAGSYPLTRPFIVCIDPLALSPRSARLFALCRIPRWPRNRRRLRVLLDHHRCREKRCDSDETLMYQRFTNLAR